MEKFWSTQPEQEAIYHLLCFHSLLPTLGLVTPQDQALANTSWHRHLKYFIMLALWQKPHQRGIVPPLNLFNIK